MARQLLWVEPAHVALSRKEGEMKKSNENQSQTIRELTELEMKDVKGGGFTDPIAEAIRAYYRKHGVVFVDDIQPISTQDC